jgi:thioredoxin reductase
MGLKTWSDTVILFTNGNHYFSSADMRLLKKYSILVHKEKIKRLEGSKQQLREIILESGEAVSCNKMFFGNNYSQQSNLAEELGCRLSKHNVIVTKKSGHTSVPGLYVAGDASWDIHLVVIAAAEGAKAGVYINKQLQKEEKEKIRSSKNRPRNSSHPVILYKR